MWQHIYRFVCENETFKVWEFYVDKREIKETKVTKTEIINQMNRNQNYFKQLRCAFVHILRYFIIIE